MTELNFSRLGPADEDQLYSAIKETMVENGGHNLDNYDKNFWKWQYANLPSRKSFVYVCKNNDGKILAYYHIPLYYGRFDQAKTLYAMIQDVAVNNTLRGQGVFRRIATYANEDLDKEGIKLIYTFPNNKSIHTFTKYNNYNFIESLPSYIFPLDAKSIIASRLKSTVLSVLLGTPVNFVHRALFSKHSKESKLEITDSFTDEILTIYNDYQSRFKYGLIRDQSYLNWRYLEKPNQNIHILSLRNSNSELTATVILKEELIMNIPTLILMDYAYRSEGVPDILALISMIRNNKDSLFDKNFGIIFMCGISPLYSKLHKIGSFKIPNKLVPRPLNLLVRSNYQNSVVERKEEWYVSLSDWDVL